MSSPIGSKRCTGCGIEKSLSDFTKNRRYRGGLATECKLCSRKRSAEWAAANPDRKRETDRLYRESHREQRRETDFRRNFGIGIDEYNRLLAEQNGVCRICELPCQRRLAVDHDHKTGRVRGLLCNNCNLALGKFKDDPALLRAAAAYLEES